MSPVEAAHFKIWNPIDFHCKTLVRNYWHCRISQKLLKFLQGVLLSEWKLLRNSINVRKRLPRIYLSHFNSFSFALLVFLHSVCFFLLGLSIYFSNNLIFMEISGIYFGTLSWPSKILNTLPTSWKLPGSSTFHFSLMFRVHTWSKFGIFFCQFQISARWVNRLGSVRHDILCHLFASRLDSSQEVLPFPFELWILLPSLQRRTYQHFHHDEHLVDGGHGNEPLPRYLSPIESTWAGWHDIRQNQHCFRLYLLHILQHPAILQVQDRHDGMHRRPHGLLRGPWFHGEPRKPWPHLQHCLLHNLYCYSTCDLDLLQRSPHQGPQKVS